MDCFMSPAALDADRMYRYTEFYFSRNCSPKLAIRIFLHPTLALNADLPPFNEHQFDLEEDFYDCL
jgi:hypothetical protein